MRNKSLLPGPILVHRDDIKNTLDALRLARIAEPGTDQFERGFMAALDTMSVAFGVGEPIKEIWGEVTSEVFNL